MKTTVKASLLIIGIFLLGNCCGIPRNSEKKIESRTFYNFKDTFLYEKFAAEKYLNNKNFPNRVIIINESIDDTIIDAYIYSNMKNIMCYDAYCNCEKTLFCSETKSLCKNRSAMSIGWNIIGSDTFLIHKFNSKKYLINYFITYNGNDGIVDVKRDTSVYIEL